MIRIKRAYDPAERSDGQRFLVDRLWPRGIRKDDLKIDAWLKEVAPSNELRHWFGHDPARWLEFQDRYWQELDGGQEAWLPMLDAARDRDITLVYGAKDKERNNAVALKAYLEKRLKSI